MMGFDTWNKAVVAVRDRSDQRRLVNGPILLEERRGQMMMMIKLGIIY